MLNVDDSLAFLVDINVVNHGISYGVVAVIADCNNVQLITLAYIPRILCTDNFFTNCVIKQCNGGERISELF